MESKKSALMLLLALFVISAMQEAPVAAARELASGATAYANDKNLSNILLAYGRDTLFKHAFNLEGVSTTDCIGFYCLYTSCCSGCQCVTSYDEVPIPAYCETSCSTST